MEGGHFLGVTWSLAIEEQFYLLLPLFVLFAGKERLIRFALPLIFIAYLLRISFPSHHSFVGMPFRMDTLLLGSVVYLLWHNNTIKHLLKTYKEVFPIVLITMLVSTWFIIKTKSFGSFSFSWFGLLYSITILTSLLYRDKPLTLILRAPSLIFFGAISYGLYMYHHAVLGLLHGWLGGGPPTLQTTRSIGITVLALGVSIAIAWVSRKYYEAYFIKLGNSKKYTE